MEECDVYGLWIVGARWYLLTVLHKIIDSRRVERFFFTVQYENVLSKLWAAGDRRLGEHLQRKDVFLGTGVIADK